MIRLLFLALTLTLSACATPSHRQTAREKADSERGEEGVRRMQDEFSAVFPDA